MSTQGSQLPSPLDKARAKLQEAAKPVAAWDLEDDDPVARQMMLRFLLNVVNQTSHNTRLAYQICHYMESDFLEIPGLSDVFPTARSEFKKAHKTQASERKKIEDDIRAAKLELRSLKAGIRGKKKGSAPDIDAAIASQEECIKDFEKDLALLSKTVEEYKESYPMKVTGGTRKRGVSEEDWGILKSFLEKRVQKRIKAADSNFLKNAELLCNHLGFGEPEKLAFTVMLLADDDDGFGELLRGLSGTTVRNAHTVMAKMIGVSRETVSAMIRSGAPLVERGIFVPPSEQNDDDDEGDPIFPTISDHLVRVLKEPDLTIESMMQQFIGEPATTHLDWDKDFAYLGEAGKEVIRMLQGAAQQKQIGVNLLFYGLPGTGKTEAIKAAAKKVGLELYVIGERSKFGREPTRADRITAAIMAQEMLSDKPNAAILLDEMEDLFPEKKLSLSQQFEEASDAGGDNQQMGDVQSQNALSKVFLNRLLERNRTLTFWAANNPERFDPAFRRRILFSIEFRVPPADVRQKIWQSVSARHSFDLSAADTKLLGANFVVAPGLMENAIVHAKLSGGGIDSIRGNLKAAAGLMFRNRRAIDARDSLPAHYDLRFLNATVQASDFDLRTLGENIKASGRRDFSLLLLGPPGTGKTQYLSYLANLLEMDVMLKDAASLTSKFVGETEKRISAAFSEAEERGMFLVINEGDTFVRRRDELGQNHEVSAVNIMLTCMERHQMPFGFTTNLGKNIDPAAKRRFLFKVALDYLTPEQSTAAFEHFFKKPCSPDRMKQLPKLVPADFVNVNKQIGFMNGEMTEERLLRLLALEAKERADTYNAQLYDGRDGGWGFGTQQRAP